MKLAVIIFNITRHFKIIACRNRESIENCKKFSGARRRIQYHAICTSQTLESKKNNSSRRPSGGIKVRSTMTKIKGATRTEQLLSQHAVHAAAMHTGTGSSSSIQTVVIINGEMQTYVLVI